MAVVAVALIGTHTVNRGDRSLVNMSFWRVISTRVAKAANVPMVGLYLSRQSQRYKRVLFTRINLLWIRKSTSVSPP